MVNGTNVFNIRGSFRLAPGSHRRSRTPPTREFLLCSISCCWLVATFARLRSAWAAPSAMSSTSLLLLLFIADEEEAVKAVVELLLLRLRAEATLA